MPHKISEAQFCMLMEIDLGSTGFRCLPGAYRLLDGEGTDTDLDEVAKWCIRQGHNALARELLLPPESRISDKPKNDTP